MSSTPGLSEDSGFGEDPGFDEDPSFRGQDEPPHRPSPGPAPTAPRRSGRGIVFWYLGCAFIALYGLAAAIIPFTLDYGYYATAPNSGATYGSAIYGPAFSPLSTLSSVLPSFAIASLLAGIPSFIGRRRHVQD